MSKVSELNLKIDGMHCASCVGNVENSVNKLDGVVKCQVNLAMSSAYVEYRSSDITSNEIIDTIIKTGYSAEPGRADILLANKKEYSKSRSDFLISLLITLPLMVIAMLPMITGVYYLGESINSIAQAVLAGLVLFYAGRHILADAFKQSLNFHANMNSLIAMGTLTSYFWSVYALIQIFSGTNELLYFDSSAMIITLILLGRFLEAKSKGKAGEAIKALLQLTPSKALAVINNVEIEIDTAVVKADMILIVRPGERIPADGEITEGSPNIDESMLTGESMPVDKKSGDYVYGGSLNSNVSFRMKVTASGDKTFLASIIRLVTDAQSKKAPVQKLADKVASVFVPIVIGIALITFASWYIFDPESPMLIKSVISVLIIACPCSLGLATPTAILAGTGRAAKEGIIIRGGDVLENITKLNTIVFDKTGTLTHGQLEVAEIKTFGQFSLRKLVSLAASVELHSEHPVAKAIVKNSKLQQIDTIVVKKAETLPGFGMKAICDGREVLIGNATLMTMEKASFGVSKLAGQQEMSKGRTVVFVAMDKQVIGLLALSDKIRPESKEVVHNLKTKLQLQVTMLSGDTYKSAGGVARSIGIDNFEAEVKPDQKKFIVESLHKAGYKVGMVGDGINDAPALAVADVGIAIGSGTDIAIEAADVVLVRSELHNLEKMFNISIKTMKIIKQNLFWAFFYNIAAIPIAAGLFYPLFGWSLSPIIAAFAMSFSSIFVVANSIRLNNVDIG